MMKNYEITFITRENPDDKLFKTVLENAGGKILNVSSIGERQFVYPIKKETRGVYTTVLFEVEPDKISDLNRKMSLNDEILRFLMVTKKASALKAMAETAAKKPVAEIEAPKEIAEPIVIAEPKELPEPEKIVEPVKVIKPKKEAKPKATPKVETPKTPQEPEVPEMSEEDRLKELDKKLDELLKD